MKPSSHDPPSSSILKFQPKPQKKPLLKLLNPVTLDDFYCDQVAPSHELSLNPLNPVSSSYLRKSSKLIMPNSKISEKPIVKNAIFIHEFVEEVVKNDPPIFKMMIIEINLLSEH